MWPWTIIGEQRQKIAVLRERQEFLMCSLQEAMRRAAELRTENMILKAKVAGFEGAEAELQAARQGKG